MKKLILLISLFLLVGCSKYDEEYYINYADTVVSLFKDANFDRSSIYEEDLSALDEYVITLTHENEKINIEEYLLKDEPSLESDSSLVIVENNTCYIKYDDLRKIFDEYNNAVTEEGNIEAHFEGVCRGDPFVIYESDLIPPYEEITSNPKFDYVLLKDEKKKDEYIFYYRSTYDGTGLQVSLKLNKKHVIQIHTDFVNVDSIIQGKK